MRVPYAHSLRDIPAVVDVPSTRAVSYTIFGAISAQRVVSAEVRVIEARSIQSCWCQEEKDHIRIRDIYYWNKFCLLY